MILRRVIAHVRNQEWTAIGIDLVIVVVGVFIGIQVSNWNIERETRQKAAVFTERLRADLREEAWYYQALIEYYDDVLENAESTVAALSGKLAASNEVLLVSAYRATQYKQKWQRRATYDELVSTGIIGLIEDQTLRDTAMWTYNSPMFDRIVKQGLDSRYREAFRMSIPSDVQRVLNKQCGDHVVAIGDYKAIVDPLQHPCATGLPDDVLDEAANALRSNEVLVSLLRLRIADIDSALVNLTVTNQDLLQGLHAIAEDKP